MLPRRPYSLARIPYTHRRASGTYVLRKRISFRNQRSQHISYSLRTKEPCVARIRAAAACAALDRVVTVLNISFSVNGGARPASELAEIARRALDSQLGFALQEQLAGPDPDAEEAARVFGDFYALAAHQGGTVTIDGDVRAKLVAEGRTPGHMRKLDLLVRHNTGCQPLSDRHLEFQLEAMGMTFRSPQASVDRQILLRAWADAQFRAAQLHSPAVQDQPQPIQYLLDAGKNAALTGGQAHCPSQSASIDVEDNPPSTAPSMPLLSEIIPKIVAGIVEAGNWQGGPGSVAEDAERLLGQVAWMIGDLPVDQYTQRHIADFHREMMAMPKTVRAKTVWHQPYAVAKKSFPLLTSKNKRNVRTMNKDLAYISTFAERMVSEGYWAEEAIQPLRLSHKVSKKQKQKAKAPWTIEHVRQMLSCPIYSGNGGPKRRLRPGDFLYQDAAYWLLPLAAFSAGCQEELAGLLIDDLVFDTAIPFMVIRENSLRGLKRDARERVVPIHPRLLALGFQEYVECLRQEGATQVFPELWINPVKRGGDQYRAIVWDKLIIWLRAQEVVIPLGINGKAADFHSIRSTVLSLLDRADINQNIVKDIAGHAREGVTAGTYQDLVASGGLDEALRERLIILKRLPDFMAGIAPFTPKLPPLNQRSR